MKAVLDAAQIRLGRLITVEHGTLEAPALCQLLTGAGALLAAVRHACALQAARTLDGEVVGTQRRLRALTDWVIPETRDLPLTAIHLLIRGPAQGPKHGPDSLLLLAEAQIRQGARQVCS